MERAFTGALPYLPHCAGGEVKSETYRNLRTALWLAALALALFLLTVMGYLA